MGMAIAMILLRDALMIGLILAVVEFVKKPYRIYGLLAIGPILMYLGFLNLLYAALMVPIEIAYFVLYNHIHYRESYMEFTQNPLVATFNRRMSLVDASEEGGQPVILPGRYELERIQNPIDYMRRYQPYWFVLKGTQVGLDVRGMLSFSAGLAKYLGPEAEIKLEGLSPLDRFRQWQSARYTERMYRRAGWMTYAEKQQMWADLGLEFK